MQDVGVKCESRFIRSLHCRLILPRAAEGFRNDPRNPYAAQIAKESESHH